MKDNKRPSKDDIGELHQMEIDLILTLRHEFPFGQVEIEMRDGLPQYLLKTVNRRKLGNFQVIHRVDLTKIYPELYNKSSR
jgi:hypothetical protein